MVCKTQASRVVSVAALAVVLLAPASVSPANAVVESRVALTGSGSTFAARYYRSMIPVLGKSVKAVNVQYRAIGSGRGKAEFGEGTTDFAGTDSVVKATDGLKPDEFLYVPTTAGAIAVAFKLKGVNDLRLSPSTLAKIFQRDIKMWNHPEIASENPTVRLPNKSIGVVHRADGSGTTNNFTKFLELAAPEVWRLGSGDQVQWPPDTSQGDGTTRWPRS